MAITQRAPCATRAHYTPCFIDNVLTTASVVMAV